MINFVAAILILSATESASRSKDVADETIAGIMLRVAAGGVQDILHRPGEGLSFTNIVKRFSDVDLQLEIDGFKQIGAMGWVRAVVRIVAYTADWQKSGAVHLIYTFHFDEYVVRRESVYSNDHVVFITDISWVETVPITRRITKTIPIAVRFTITASNVSAAVHIDGLAQGSVDLSGFRCPLIKKVADRKAADKLSGSLSAALLKIDQQGTVWFHSANLPSIIKDIRDTLKIAWRMRRNASRTRTDV